VSLGSLENALEEAKATGESGPPPDWVRLVAGVGSEEAAAAVMREVGNVSEGLQPLCTALRSWHRSTGSGAATAGGGEAVAVSRAWTVSVSVPPRAMVLVSSMIGEALYEVEPEGDGGLGAPPPMLLAENLEDGQALEDATYLCGAVPKEALPAAGVEDLARGCVEAGLAARSYFDDVAGTITLQTTGACRVRLQGWLQDRGVDVATVAWTPVGGSGEYLQWLAAAVEGDAA